MKSYQDIAIDVSVVVPVYNVKQYLHRCIKSLLNQDFSNYEIILVDDGSTDDSGKICDDYAQNQDFIRVVHKKNGGLSSARLAGFKASCGKYLCFIDSDDYLKENYLKDLYDSIVVNNAEMSICAYYYEKEGNQSPHLLSNNSSCITDIKEDFVLPIVSENNNFSNKMLPNFMWLRMIKREIISEDLFVSERDVYQEDLVFNLLVSNKLNCISLINKPNYVYCHNGASLTEKYRDNAWQMQINLYDTISRFCQDNGFSVEVSLAKRLINAVVFTVRNAAKTDYKRFLQDIKVMKKDRMYTTASKHFSLHGSSSSHKMVFMCLRLHLYFLLFKIFKRK